MLIGGGDDLLSVLILVFWFFCLYVFVIDMDISVWECKFCVFVFVGDGDVLIWDGVYVLCF